MSQKDKPGLALNKITAGLRDRSEWSGWPSDIEGKTTRVGASECGQRTSFNRTREPGQLDEIQGVVANTPCTAVCSIANIESNSLIWSVLFINVRSARLRPNENEMSDGHREQAPLA